MIWNNPKKTLPKTQEIPSSLASFVLPLESRISILWTRPREENTNEVYMSVTSCLFSPGSERVSHCSDVSAGLATLPPPGVLIRHWGADPGLWLFLVKSSKTKLAWQLVCQRTAIRRAWPSPRKQPPPLMRWWDQGLLSTGALVSFPKGNWKNLQISCPGIWTFI